MRNSGAVAVIEGAGDHCCEYMTGGVVVVLGRTGRNFAAGMSGGIAYILDEDGTFQTRCNMAMIELETIDTHMTQDLTHLKDNMTGCDAERLKKLLENHAHYTNSTKAQTILADWAHWLPKFKKIMPIEFRRALNELDNQRDNESGKANLPPRALAGE